MERTKKMKKITILCFLGVVFSPVFAQENTVKDNSIPGLWKSSIEIIEKGNSIMKNENEECISKEYLETHSKIDLLGLLNQKKLICEKIISESNETISKIAFMCNPPEENKNSSVTNIKISYQSNKQYNEINTDYINKNTSEIVMSIKIKGQRLGSCK